MGKKGGDDYPVRKKRQGDRKNKDKKYKNYVGNDRKYNNATTTHTADDNNDDPTQNEQDNQNNQLVQNET